MISKEREAAFDLGKEKSMNPSNKHNIRILLANLLIEQLFTTNPYC